jgi:hypothetical protein
MSLATTAQKRRLAAAVSLAWHISLSSTRRHAGRIPSVVLSCVTSAIRRWKGWGRLHRRFTSKNTPTTIYCLGCVRLYLASRCRWLKRETGIGLLEEIAAGLRRLHSEPPSRSEGFTAVLSERCRRGVFRLSSQSPRLRAASRPFFGRIEGC